MLIPKKSEIKQRRETIGLTKASLSKKAGLPANALSRIESSKSSFVHPIRARAIAEALECQVEDVFTLK